MKQPGNLTIIGQAELIDFPVQKVNGVPARIDTGARTSALWASNIKTTGQTISFTLFDTGSPYFTGKTITLDSHDETVVASSVGMPQKRYKVRLSIRIHGKRIKAAFTLADRSAQVYPVLIGRNTLRGKFIVDVKAGTVMHRHERDRTAELRALLDKEEQGDTQ